MSPTAPTRPLSVLIVEDHADSARTLARLVRLHGHRVEVAADGEEGLRAAGEFTPDVALLDIGLPKMSGWELAERLRQLLPARPLLVAVTGYGTDQDRERSRRAGFDYHFTKPIDPAVLTGLLRAEAERLAAGD
jgi:CheY-like chemotaxis protein